MTRNTGLFNCGIVRVYEEGIEKDMKEMLYHISVYYPNTILVGMRKPLNTLGEYSSGIVIETGTKRYKANGLTASVWTAFPLKPDIREV
jgi:hypothetical protein